MIELIYFLVLFVIIESLGIVGLYFRSQLSKERNMFVVNFPSYKLVLDYFLERAYDIVNKDKMLLYSIEATRVTDEQFNEYAKDFAKLTITLMGPMLQKEFSNLFGSEKTFFSNLMEFFSTKYEDDAIRKTAIDGLMSEETATPVKEK